MKLEVKSPEIPHPREKVYAALIDPAVLARLLPGVEKFAETGPDQYAVEVKLGVGAIKGSYQGSVEIFDHTPPEGYKLRGDAKGGLGRIAQQKRLSGHAGHRGSEPSER